MGVIFVFMMYGEILVKNYIPSLVSLFKNDYICDLKKMNDNKI